MSASDNDDQQQSGAGRGHLAPVTWLPGARAESSPASAGEDRRRPVGDDDLPTLRSVLGEVDELLERRRARMGASRHPARGSAGSTGDDDASSGWATPGVDHEITPSRRSSFVDAEFDDEGADDESDGADGEAEDPLGSGPLAREEQAAERAAAKAARKAENVAMHALTRRGMSRREMERVLGARELDEESVASELARLESVGLIDDVALAQQLVGTLQERKGLGRTAIAAELTRRLLSPAAIEYALELVDSGDELARAREIAIKRATQLRSLDHETAVRRLSSYLARRGYSGSTVRTAVDAALAPSRRGSGVRFS